MILFLKARITRISRFHILVFPCHPNQPKAKVTSTKIREIRVIRAKKINTPTSLHTTPPAHSALAEHHSVSGCRNTSVAP